jgi:hypothetical protein
MNSAIQIISGQPDDKIPLLSLDDKIPRKIHPAQNPAGNARDNAGAPRKGGDRSSGTMVLGTWIRTYRRKTALE